MPPAKQKQQDDGAKRVQDEWRKTAEKELPELIEKLLEAAKAEIDKRLSCPHCHRAIVVRAADIRARTDAINSLLDRGFGKPVADQGAGGSFVVKRTIVRPEGVNGA